MWYEVGVKIKIKFVGDGTLRRTIEKFSLSNKIQENVSVTGWLSDKEIISVLSYIKSTWPNKVKKIHDQINHREKSK